MAKMRLSLRIGRARRRNPVSLDDLVPGASGVLARIDLPEADATRLMEIGFLPGARIVPAGLHNLSGKVELPDPKTRYWLALTTADQPALATSVTETRSEEHTSE